MTLHLLSADHRTQGLDAVARLGAVSTHLGPDLVNAVPALRGALVLPTCNRLALLLDAPPSAPGRAERDAQHLDGAVAAFLAERSGAPVVVRPGAEAAVDPDAALLTTWAGHDAHTELFATAAGLESMVVGEREIAGQLRRALKRATEEGTATADVVRAVEHASTTSRRVASETGLAGNGRSVVAVGLDLAERSLPPLASCRVLIVGTGAYAGATVTALRERGATDIEVYSRSDRAQAFAEGHRLRPVSEAELPGALELADLVVTCRGLGAPVLTRELVEPAARLRRPAGAALLDRREEPASRAVPAERPLVILDFALTRDVERSVGALPGVLLIDLPSVQRAVPEAEAQQVSRARAVVDEEVAVFERLLGGRRMDPVVRAMRGLVDDVVQIEVDRLPVQDGKVDADAAERALRHLAARIMHHPTVAARQAGETGRDEDYLASLGLLIGDDVADALLEDLPLPPSHCPAKRTTPSGEPLDGAAGDASAAGPTTAATAAAPTAPTTVPEPGTPALATTEESDDRHED